MNIGVKENDFKNLYFINFPNNEVAYYPQSYLLAAAEIIAKR